MFEGVLMAFKIAAIKWRARFEKVKLSVDADCLATNIGNIWHGINYWRNCWFDLELFVTFFKARLTVTFIYSLVDHQDFVLHDKIGVGDTSWARIRWHRQEIRSFLLKNVTNASQLKTVRWSSDDSILEGLRMGREGARPTDGQHRSSYEHRWPLLLSGW